MEIACKEYGLKPGSKAVLLPGSREKPSEKEEVQLPPIEARRYRGGVARANYLGQDGSDIQFSVKELSKAMAASTVGDVKKMKKLLRYLLGAPRYVYKYS